DDDASAECGAARVLAECRLERARAEVPGTLASGMQVGADASVVFVVADGSSCARAAAFVEALLDDTRSIDDDLLARVIARTALAADDAESLYPGLALQSRARLALCSGSAARSTAGSARAIQALAPARARELLRVAVPRRGWGLGLLPEALRASLAMALTGPVAIPQNSRTAAAQAIAAPEFVPHARVDSPFVAAAFLVPSSEQLPAFAIGVEVARARAWRRFRAMGREAMARAPFVSWSWLAGDPLVTFCRRGFDPRKLWPGEQAAADAEAERIAVQAELQGLLEDLRRVPPSAQELASAVRCLEVELAVAPASAGNAVTAGESALLPGRIQARLLAAQRGIDVAALAAVQASELHDVLRSTLAAERAWWGGLMPYPLPGVGWSSR
ncbi:MAG: hypothetical protein ABIP94_21015, partial [Planctomycetota bacterium]